jgi:hypothetical protein
MINCEEIKRPEGSISSEREKSVDPEISPLPIKSADENPFDESVKEAAVTKPDEGPIRIEPVRLGLFTARDESPKAEDRG